VAIQTKQREIIGDADVTTHHKFSLSANLYLINLFFKKQYDGSNSLIYLCHKYGNPHITKGYNNSWVTGKKQTCLQD